MTTDPDELLAAIPPPELEPPGPGPTDEPPAASSGRQKRPTTRAGRASRSTGQKRTAGSSDRAPAGPRKAPLGKRVGELYEGVGALIALGEPDIGQAVMACGPAAGEAWAEVARNNPRVAAALERMLTGSAYGGLLMAHLPILLAVMARTGRTPSSLAAVFTPTPGPVCPACGVEAGAGHAPGCPLADPDAPMFTATVPPPPPADAAAA